MGQLSKEQQETYLQTIRARLEWNEKGSVSAIFDPSGPWKIVQPNEYTSALIKYFTPISDVEYDKFGTPSQQGL